MTPERQLEIVRRHYDLHAAGDFAAAGELLTDDFFIEIPSYMPFAGVYRGKGAFRELIPIVVESVAVKDMKFVATTVGGDYAVEIVEFTLVGDDGPTTQVAELIRFRDEQICEIRPFYSDPNVFIAAARKQVGDNEKLQILWDERLITHRMIEFGRSLDTADWAAHAACFTDPVNINFKRFTGFDEVRVHAALWAQFAEALLSAAPRHHILGNCNIAIDGDRASTRVYMISSLWTASEDGTAANRQYGWYDVSFVREGESWKIARLLHDFQGVEGNAAAVEKKDAGFIKLAQEVFSPAHIEAAKVYLTQS